MNWGVVLHRRVIHYRDRLCKSVRRSSGLGMKNRSQHCASSRSKPMANDPCPPSNKKLGEIIGAAKTSGELTELLRQYNIDQVNAGWAVPPDKVDLPVNASESSEPVRANVSAYRVIYPHGNSRFELFGADEADLDRQEKQIRAMYQK
jgi:hypothetical protein